MKFGIWQFPFCLSTTRLEKTNQHTDFITFLMGSYESRKAIYDIGTKILFGSSVSHKPIKNWEIENVKV